MSLPKDEKGIPIYAFDAVGFPICGAERPDGTICPRRHRRNSGRCRLHGGYIVSNIRKVFGIAEKQSVCYGHGDNGSELKICKMGAYGSGDFPPIFLDEEKAAEWINNNKSIREYVVVSMDLHVHFPIG